MNWKIISKNIIIKFHNKRDSLNLTRMSTTVNMFIVDNLLPRMSDPKLFACPCKPGMEKETVAQIMNKFLMNKNLSIYSAAFIEKFPGYIYIEADR